MADRKVLLDTLRIELSTITKRLRSTTGLARCKVPSQRDFLAKQFLEKFAGVTFDEFDEAIYDWMTGDLPDPRSVQTLLQILVETANDSAIDTVLDCIDARVGGGDTTRNSSRSALEQVRCDAWWGDTILEPFEAAFPKKPKLRKRVRTLMSEIRKQTEVTNEQPVA